MRGFWIFQTELRIQLFMITKLRSYELKINDAGNVAKRNKGILLFR